MFQAKMDMILQGVPNCVCKEDDILIGGVSGQFLKREVVYLGLKIDAEGLHPVDEKVDAVKRAPIPQNVKELRFLLGMVQYYHPY